MIVVSKAVSSGDGYFYFLKDSFIFLRKGENNVTLEQLKGIHNLIHFTSLGDKPI
jgi:hypothetical protein